MDNTTNLNPTAVVNDLATFTPPLMNLSVKTCCSLVFIIVAIALTWRRDVKGS